VLCPHECQISEGSAGICGVRKNLKGVLYAETYGIVSAVNLDPIEKKPLYHFLPGSKILSVGSFGCNLKCEFCQNCSISQISEDYKNEAREMSIDELVSRQKATPESIGIAFTYNEPSIWYELMYDTAVAFKQHGFRTAMITNGFISKSAIENLLPLIDAFNVDLKAFNDTFYKEITHSKLQPVLETLKILSENKKHFEITNLVIPDLNDKSNEFDAMCRYIKSELGQDVPLHITRYYPHYKLSKPQTPERRMYELADIAQRHLDFVYLGNLNSKTGENTYCPECSALVVSRSGYRVKIENLSSDNCCSQCGRKLKFFEH
jgi:pyruvate formate lyase activating enzyme